MPGLNARCVHEPNPKNNKICWHCMCPLDILGGEDTDPEAKERTKMEELAQKYVETFTMKGI